MGGATMLYWAIVFLATAVVAGVFGFTAIAGASMWPARLLFFVFVALFVVSLLFGRRNPVPPG
jgi:uncharacterized membrane protein YtjA (UPF0391 family)